MFTKPPHPGIHRPSCEDLYHLFLVGNLCSSCSHYTFLIQEKIKQACLKIIKHHSPFVTMLTLKRSGLRWVNIMLLFWMLNGLEGEKRAKRKHFCFLKAVANVPVARTRPWSHMDARGAGKCSFWLALSGTSSSPWEGEQGLEWSAGHLCPSSSKRDSLT